MTIVKDKNNFFEDFKNEAKRIYGITKDATLRVIKNTKEAFDDAISNYNDKKLSSSFQKWVNEEITYENFCILANVFIADFIHAKLDSSNTKYFKKLTERELREISKRFNKQQFEELIVEWLALTYMNRYYEELCEKQDYKDSEEWFSLKY